MRATPTSGGLIEGGLANGSMLDHFRIARPLGRGSMGVVYEAEDTLLGRSVAIKTVLSSTESDPETIRLLREARAVARIAHPNVLPIFHVGQFDNGYYLVLELMRGGSLQDWVKSADPPDWRGATAAIRDACRGMAAAHALGMVHRDIKPANLMRDGAGTIKVADFGLVRGGDLTSSRIGNLVGTPHYMSPEQCRGEPTDARSDVYALGATYFALLCGAAPFTGRTPMAILFAHCTAPTPDPCAKRMNLPPQCAAIIRRAMSKEPADRYPSASEMAAALESLLLKMGEEPKPGPNSTPPAVLPWRGRAPMSRRSSGRRWRTIALAMGALLAVGLAVLAMMNRPGGEKSHPQVKQPSVPVSISQAVHTFSMGGKVGTVGYSPDGEWFAAGVTELPAQPGAEFFGMKIWTVKDGEVFRSLARGERVPALVFFSGPKDGRTIITILRGGDRGPTGWWGLEDDRENTIFDSFKPSWGEISALAAIPGKRYVIGYGTEDMKGEIRQYGWGGKTLTEFMLPEKTPVLHLAYSPHDESLVALGKDGQGHYWKVPDGPEDMPGKKLPLKDVRTVAFAPNRSVLALSDGRQIHFLHTDAPTWPEALTRPPNSPSWTRNSITTLAFTHDGQRLVVGDDQGGLALWETHDDPAKPQKQIHAFAGHRAAVLAIALSPDGRTLGSGGADGVASLWAMPP